MPKGWTVVADASKGTVVAQQDPKRKDAAQMLVMVTSGSASTDDQVLDLMLKSIANAKVVKRDPLPGGAGKVLVADGTTDGNQVRLGAIAVGNANGVIVGMLICEDRRLRCTRRHRHRRRRARQHQSRGRDRAVGRRAAAVAG